MALPGNGRGGFVEFSTDGEAERELALGGGGERLPWLESDDDEEHPGVDTGRIAALVAGVLLLVALAGTALWLFTRDTAAEEIVADGSVIEAPDEPYRTRPKEPGGRLVAGTGDTSFQVAEGRAINGKIADAPAPPPTSESAEEDEPADAVATPVPSGVGVQVGAYLSREAAEAGWSTLSGRLAPLQGRSHRVIEGMADSGRVFRLQAVAGSLDDANALCGAVKAAGGDCQVKR